MCAMSIWNNDVYVIKQKVLTIGRKYYIENGSGQGIGFCKQKMFKLKEDIRIFTDENMTSELLLIKQQQILDFSGTFAITDSKTGQLIGYVGRKGLKSIIRDTWKIFDTSSNEIATVEERSGLLAALRRLSNIAKMIPKKYDMTHKGNPIAEIVQKFQIIGDTWTITIEPNTNVDRRLIVSAALMMDIIEQMRGG